MDLGGSLFPDRPGTDQLERALPAVAEQPHVEDVQHIDGAAYRDGPLREGETPFPFEQVERGLDRGLARVFSADEVPAVRQALRDAAETEGLEAYDRFRTNPGAFGTVRGDAAEADVLGTHLREVEVYRAFLVERGSLIPIAPGEAQVGAGEDVAPNQEIGQDPGWLTPRDAEIARETWEALSERRDRLVRDVERQSGNRRAESEEMLALVDRSIETIDLIGARQDLTFSFANAESGSGRGGTGVHGLTQDGRPIVQMTIAGDRSSSVTGNRVHELYHAGEYARDRVFVAEVGGVLQARTRDAFYSGDEEVAAYRTQYAFQPRSLRQSDYDIAIPRSGFAHPPRNLSEVNRSYVEGLKGQDGRTFYPELQWKP